MGVCGRAWTRRSALREGECKMTFFDVISLRGYKPWASVDEPGRVRASVKNGYTGGNLYAGF